ncbi:hypothetical protein AHAS_Ahas03G0193800 [Arachis hypogaea]
MQADPQVDEKAVKLGSKGSSPTENAKGRCDTSKVLPPKAGELVDDSDVEESMFRPNEGGQTRHTRFESWDSVLPMCFNNDNCVKIEEMMHDIIRVTERLASNPRQV